MLVDFAHRLRDARKLDAETDIALEDVRRWLAADSRFRSAPADELDLWSFWLHDLVEGWTRSPEPFEGDRRLAGDLATRFETQWSRNWYEEEEAKKALDGLERDFDQLADWLPAQPELTSADARRLLWYRRAVRARTLRDISA